MSGHTFLECVTTLAAQIDGDREVSEAHLDQLERLLLDLPLEERDELRRQMILIVAGLSRLEVRMIATDGPLNATI